MQRSKWVSNMRIGDFSFCTGFVKSYLSRNYAKLATLIFRSYSVVERTKNQRSHWDTMTSAEPCTLLKHVFFSPKNQNHPRSRNEGEKLLHSDLTGSVTSAVWYSWRRPSYCTTISRVWERTFTTLYVCSWKFEDWTFYWSILLPSFIFEVRLIFWFWAAATEHCVQKFGSRHLHDHSTRRAEFLGWITLVTYFHFDYSESATFKISIRDREENYLGRDFYAWKEFRRDTRQR